MSSYLAQLVASFLPAPEPPPKPAPPRPVVHVAYRAGTAANPHPPSHPAHRTPWQESWDALTPAEQAWSSTE